LAAEDSLAGSGALAGDGAFYVLREITGDDIHVPELLSYTGEDQTEAAKAAISIDDTCTILGKEFTLCDADQASAYACEALCWAVEHGVMTGNIGGVLEPKGLATRAQASQMLKNYMENTWHA